MRLVDLASRPYVNRRPVRRVAVGLWIVGGLLVLVNVALYVAYWQRSARIRGELAKSEQEIQAEDEALGALERSLSGLALEEQNEHVALLNQLIGYRVFPWSLLFDHLEEVLPLDARLVSVSPDIGGEMSGSGRSSARRTSRGGRHTVLDTGMPEEVSLTLAVSVKNEEALYELLDNLFASPHFLRPDLAGESRADDSRSIQSQITVAYLVGRQEPLYLDTSLADADPGTAGTPAEGTPTPDGSPSIVTEVPDREGERQPLGGATDELTDGTSPGGSGRDRDAGGVSRAEARPGDGGVAAGEVASSDEPRVGERVGRAEDRDRTATTTGRDPAESRSGRFAGTVTGTIPVPPASTRTDSVPTDPAPPLTPPRTAPPRIPPPTREPVEDTPSGRTPRQPERPAPLDPPASGSPGFRRGDLGRPPLDAPVFGPAERTLGELREERT